MLPIKWSWIEKLSTLPKLVDAALSFYGTKEIPGKSNNTVIMKMAKSIDVDDIYTNDDISWCALFISYLMVMVGKPMPYTKWECLRAKTFVDWGEEVDGLDNALLGDIVVLSRPGGYHVFILLAVSKDGKNVFGIGGNQSNSVNISEFKSERIVAIRRYYKTGIPITAQKYIVDSDGNFSQNEA